MAFPVFYQNQILFRDGKPATSVKCCCRKCRECQYFYYAFAVAGEAVLSWRPGPAPVPPDCTLYFYHYYTTPADDPIFTAYNSHLWIWESCIIDGFDERLNDGSVANAYSKLGEAVEQFHIQNAIETTGAPPASSDRDFGLCRSSGGFGESNYWKSSMLNLYGGTSIASAVSVRVIDLIPPRWKKCG